MHLAYFLYLMKVIKHGGLFFQYSYFFKKLQSGLLSGPKTGRSCRETFQFVFTKMTHPFWNHGCNSKFMTSLPFLSIGFRVSFHADQLYVVICN